MPTLILRHIEQPSSTGSPCFQLIESGGITLGPIEVKPAAGYPVEGRPDDDLMSELRWYLEDFLKYPFHPETEHAERILKALKSWAAIAFNAFFESGEGADLFARTTSDGAGKLRLRIESTDPRILSWPWEVLGHAGEEPIGRRCWVERSLGSLEAPSRPLAELPRDRVNILLVTARPEGERDVGYRSISRPMIDLVEKEEFPVDVHVLRPPTFERLSAHLQERPGHYHILHFDGHGSYRPTSAVRTSAVPSKGSSSFQLRTADAHPLQGSEGCLIFEDDICGDRAINAPLLGDLLRQHDVPIVVLNACQSAMLDDAAETAFASVAASLIKAGTRSVVAMAYSLYVSAASEFLPAFYRGLLASGSVAEGVLAGRQRLARARGRVCARGRFDLEDWLVPVLYQHDDIDLSFAIETREHPAATPPHPLDLDGPALDHFVGRDGAILELERAYLRKPAGLLIHGLGGVGKTTLARGFLDWLARTEGLGMGCFWFSFQEVRSAEYVWNRLGERLVGRQFAVLEPKQKIAQLAEILCKNRLIIAWDNFEVVTGIEGTSAMPTLPKEDREQLSAFLTELRGGLTKVIITSRSDEEWLGQRRQIVALSGLRGEERWSYCNEVLRDLDVEIDREDSDLEELMDRLGGHPLAMRVLLPELTRRSAGQLIKALGSNLATLKADHADEAKLYATLGFAEEGLDPKYRPLLVPLSLHEQFVDGEQVESMAQEVDPAISRREIEALLRHLAGAGLLRESSPSIFEIHPALTGFLRSTSLRRVSADIRDLWARAFVKTLGALADDLAPRPLHEQRPTLQTHDGNFAAALKRAQQLGMATEQATLHQAMGEFARNQRSFSEAERQFRKLADLRKSRGESNALAAAYHQLGRISKELHQLDKAENWYQKSLDISRDLDDKNSIAATCHTLGSIAAARQQHRAAEDWYQSSLEISTKLKDEKLLAMTYFQLGRSAQAIKDFDRAQEYYRKSLEIDKKLCNTDGIATTWGQLGIVAQELGYFDLALRWYRKCLNIKEELEDDHGAAVIYHQIGMVHHKQKDFHTASRTYKKSLVIKEKLGNLSGAAITCHQLGRIASDSRDFSTAKEWFLKSLRIKKQIGNEHGAAATCSALGVIAALQLQYDESGHWFARSIKYALSTNDSAFAETNSKYFMNIFNESPQSHRLKLRSLWDTTGLPWPEEDTNL